MPATNQTRRFVGREKAVGAGTTPERRVGLRSPNVLGFWKSASVDGRENAQDDKSKRENQRRVRYGCDNRVRSEVATASWKRRLLTPERRQRQKCRSWSEGKNVGAEAAQAKTCSTRTILLASFDLNPGAPGSRELGIRAKVRIEKTSCEIECWSLGFDQTRGVASEEKV